MGEGVEGVSGALIQPAKEAVFPGGLRGIRGMGDWGEPPLGQ